MKNKILFSGIAVASLLFVSSNSVVVAGRGGPIFPHPGHSNSKQTSRPPVRPAVAHAKTKEEIIKSTAATKAKATIAALKGTFKQETEEGTLEKLKSLRVSLYEVNLPHAHDTIIPEAVGVALDLFQVKYPNAELLSFDQAKKTFLEDAKLVDAGKIATPAPRVELGAKKHKNYEALLSSRLASKILLEETKKLLPTCLYLAQNNLETGVGGLISACGIEGSASSTDSGIYNDLYSYLVESLDQKHAQEKAEAFAEREATTTKFTVEECLKVIEYMKKKS